MRTLVLLALVLAMTAFLPGVQAQPPSFDEPYQVRGAVGDIPTTPATEPAGTWNVEQMLKVQFDNTASEVDRTYLFRLPPGSTLVNATCDCERSTRSQVGTTLSFRIESLTASGERTIRILTSQAAGDVFGSHVSPTTPIDTVIVLYVPTGSEVTANVDFVEVGLTSSNSAVIHYARLDAAESQDPWFAIHPATTAATPEGGDGANPLSWLIPLLVGVAVGMVVWATLVSRGAVQKKSRKQLTTTAAHVEAAANDPPAVLEGKKRALLAALKEIELARQANEMPVEVYDVVKADLKKQAVTVMRALETSSAEAKS